VANVVMIGFLNQEVPLGNLRGRIMLSVLYVEKRFSADGRESC
jgi:hypothetical protein